MERVDDSAIGDFMGITGVGTSEEAQNFLEMAGGNLEQAIALYMDLQGGGGMTQDVAEDVRAPMESFEDRIVDMEADQRHMERLVEEDACAMQNRMQFDNHNHDDPNAGDNNSERQESVLNSLFAAPAFSEKRPWFECLQIGKDTSRWIFVNIQHKEQFESHRLNRDLWSDETVIETITANFVFWQRDTDSTEGSVFCQRYMINVKDKNALPALCVVDPRTGQCVKSWNARTWTSGGPHAAADFLYSFLDRNTLASLPGAEVPSKRPVPESTNPGSSESSDVEPQPQRVKEDSPREPASTEAEKAQTAELPTVDESKPKTQIRIRFIDGSQKAFPFNEDHCVKDLYAVVISVLGTGDINICGGFPPKPITDMDVTLREAGLCQSSVVVRKK